MVSENKNLWSQFRGYERLKNSMVEFTFEYFVDKWNISEYPDLPFFMCALLYPSEWLTILEFYSRDYADQYANILKIKNLVSKIQDILNKYTNKKLELYLSIPELKFMLMNYVKLQKDSISNNSCYKAWVRTIFKN